MSKKPDSTSILERLTRDFRANTQYEDARSLEIVDFLMRAYAYTRDEMTPKAEKMGADLRALVESWRTNAGDC